MRAIGLISEVIEPAGTSTADIAVADIASSIADENVAVADEEENADNSADVADGMRRCRNCGTVCDTPYCGVCGQSMSIERLRFRKFMVDMLLGLFRVNRGFFFTAKHLLLRPWKVIRDYVQGRRIAYTPPVNMLVLLSFIGTILTGLFRPDRNGNITTVEVPVDSTLFYRLGLALGDFVANSEIAHNLTIYLPALLAIPLVYRKHGSKRYNVAEYSVAMIYMACSFMIFRILIMPLYLMFPDVKWSLANLIYTILISGASLYMAFPMSTKKARIKHFIYYLLAVFTVYMLFVLLLSVGIVSIWY